MSTDNFEILEHKVKKGESAFLELEIAKLHTRTPIKIPVIVNRSKVEGPVLLLMAGVHGDEVNGVSIVREMIKRKYHIPNIGTIICIPVLNVFGYLNQERVFPDGRDLNRVFPGASNGSLASQFAYMFRKEILPLVDYIIDFHTGGASLDNMPQIRCAFTDNKSLDLAKVFNPPFIINSSYVKNSVRETATKMGKTILLFEGGESKDIDKKIVMAGVAGACNVIKHLGMLHGELNLKNEPVYISKSKWIRAANSGMFYASVVNGTLVEKGDVLGLISDPYGEFEKKVRAPHKGYVFCVNNAPVVNKGNAIFHISVELGE
jgi:hypothetical protein